MHRHSDQFGPKLGTGTGPPTPPPQVRPVYRVAPARRAIQQVTRLTTSLTGLVGRPMARYTRASEDRSPRHTLRVVYALIIVFAVLVLFGAIAATLASDAVSGLFDWSG